MTGPKAPELDARAVEQRFGARLERLADGALVASIASRGAATDQAAHAARCALAMRDALPGATLVLATGRGILGGKLPVGDVIDRAARQLGMPELPDAVRVDELTAGLLDARFEMVGDTSGLSVIGEREVGVETRTLMGKRAPFVGRDRELRMITDTAAEAFEEPVACALLLTAPAGIGKSRLRHEALCARATRRRRSGRRAPTP
jgi:hypothetical protein